MRAVPAPATRCAKAAARRMPDTPSCAIRRLPAEPVTIPPMVPATPAALCTTPGTSLPVSCSNVATAAGANAAAPPRTCVRPLRRALAPELAAAGAVLTAVSAAGRRKKDSIGGRVLAKSRARCGTTVAVRCKAARAGEAARATGETAGWVTAGSGSRPAPRAASAVAATLASVLPPP